jgi:AAA15 family ATPase/GTPase
MLKEYEITNFKAFAGPESLPIKPITLIFGPNSSGKSAILQSFLMLKQTLDEAVNSTPTLLTKGKLVDLGSYREFIHNHDLGKSFSIKAMMKRPEDIGVTFPVTDNIRS